MISPTKSWFLADDLSGALEVGANWRNAGHPLKVGCGCLGDDPCGALVGISSETRNASQSEARERLRSVLASNADRQLIFKKIDSTMRGPVGAELCAIVAAYPGRPVLLTPSNPAAGRTVENGRLFVGGIPVSQTAFASDPTCPIISDSLSELLLRSGGSGVALVARSATENREGGLSETLLELWRQKQVIVADSATDEDLERLLIAAQAARPDFLPVGSGAMGVALERLGGVKTRAPFAEVGRLSARRVLFIVGSAHPRSRRQLDHAQNELGLRVIHLTLTEAKRVASGSFEESVVANVSQELRTCGRAALASGIIEKGTRLASSDALSMANALGSLGYRASQRGQADLLYVTGGEVARAVLEAARCASIELVGEYEPGIAIGKLTPPEGKPVILVVKPGGFGDDRLLERLWRHVAGG